MSEVIHIDCDCRYPAHTIRFKLEKKDEPTGFPTEVYVDYQLVQYESFWKRFKNSLHYLFRGRPTSCWDSTILTNDSCERLKLFLDNALKDW